MQSSSIYVYLNWYIFSFKIIDVPTEWHKIIYMTLTLPPADFTYPKMVERCLSRIMKKRCCHTTSPVRPLESCDALLLHLNSCIRASHYLEKETHVMHRDSLYCSLPLEFDFWHFSTVCANIHSIDVQWNERSKNLSIDDFCFLIFCCLTTGYCFNHIMYTQNTMSLSEISPSNF